MEKETRTRRAKKLSNPSSKLPIYEKETKIDFNRELVVDNRCKRRGRKRRQ